MAERATGIAYGIEFFVGRRERDRAISDVRAAGELLNQQSLRTFRKGAQDRQQAHDQAVQKLRRSSQRAMDQLAKSREKAAKQAVSSYESLKPPTPEEYASGRNLGVGELDEYRAGFERTIRAMDNSLAGFAKRASDVGMSFEGTGIEDVVKGFSEGDAPMRKAALDDQTAEVKRRETIIAQKKKEQKILVKQVAQGQIIDKQLKRHIKSAKEHLNTLQIGTPEYAEQIEHLKMLHGMKTRNINKQKELNAQLAKNIEELEKQEDLREQDKALLNELRALHSQLTAEEMRAGKKIKENKQKERDLDRLRKEADKAHIQALKEQSRMTAEYSRHIDDAASSVGSTLKNAFVIGTAAITALNYKLMAVVETFKEFETQIINANSIWQESNETLFQISDSVVEFGTKFGVQMGNATQGLYQYASAGVEAAEAQEMLQHTLKLSMAVQGDHNTLSKLTTQTLMGFGMQFSETAALTDKFAHAINMSLIEWDDLASSIKFALPFFTSTGQSIDQLLGGLQVLTNRALEAGIAGRGLRQALAEFTQHAEDNSAAFRKLGVEILDTEGNMKELTDIAQQFNSAMGTGTSDMEAMIAMMEDLNVRGATAFVHLAQNADEFSAAVNDLQNSAGAATKMAEVQQESLANQIQVVKNALLAPFLLSDETAKATGHMNKFAEELHSIVDVVEDLFIKKLPDGTTELTKLSITIRDFVIGAIHQVKEVLIVVVGIIQDFSKHGNDMTGMLKAFTIPLVAATKLIRTFGSGFLEAIIAYKLMNKILPINNLLLAKNINMLMKEARAQEVVKTQTYGTISVKDADMRITQLQGMITREKTDAVKDSMIMDQLELKIARTKVVSNMSVAGSIKAIAFSQMGVNTVMFASMYLSQRYAKNNTVLAATIGALAGAFMGLSIAVKLFWDAASSWKDLGANFWITVGAMSAIGAGYNVMMQKMMAPPDIDYSGVGANIPVYDTGGSFMPRARTYDMGGYTPEHGLAMLQKGETVIPKTQNMLDQGITINMGDVYANDGTDFADKLADELPVALQRVSDRGGI
tara:strand:+ start:5327 stop:8452 length:3126 start_codon:yes stop_codon:yes gene_type:complete